MRNPYGKLNNFIFSVTLGHIHTAVTLLWVYIGCHCLTLQQYFEAGKLLYLMFLHMFYVMNQDQCFSIQTFKRDNGIKTSVKQSCTFCLDFPRCISGGCTCTRIKHYEMNQD